MIQREAEGDLQSSSSSDSGSDIDPTRDVISSKIQPQEYQEIGEEVVIKAHKKKQAKEPVPKAYNPLVDRPSFLRKVRSACNSSLPRLTL